MEWIFAILGYKIATRGIPPSPSQNTSAKGSLCEFFF